MISVAVIDDHEAIRVGMAAALGSHRDTLDVVGDFPDVPSFVRSGLDANVVLLDLQLADGSDPHDNVVALTAVGHLVLVYSIADNPRLLRRALAGGAAGVCLKADPIHQTVQSIEAVAAGDLVVSQEVLSLIEGDEVYVAANLGHREREVLALYAAGLDVPTVAEHLGIAENSVKEYLKRIRAKYTLVNRPAASKLELFRRAIEDGIVPPVQPLA